MRRVLCAVAALVALFDLAVAIVWQQWCRDHCYAEQLGEFDDRLWT